jgi:hypothetical protein
MGGGIRPEYPGARNEPATGCQRAAKSLVLSKAESSGSESLEKDSDSGSNAVNKIAESDRTCMKISGKCYRHEERLWLFLL